MVAEANGQQSSPVTSLSRLRKIDQLRVQGTDPVPRLCRQPHRRTGEDVPQHHLHRDTIPSLILKRSRSPTHSFFIYQRSSKAEMEDSAHSETAPMNLQLGSDDGDPEHTARAKTVRSLLCQYWNPTGGTLSLFFPFAPDCSHFGQLVIDLAVHESAALTN